MQTNPADEQNKNMARESVESVRPVGDEKGWWKGLFCARA